MTTHEEAWGLAKRMMGGEFKGVLVTDFYAGYNDYAGEHQRCWVHLLRDLHDLKKEHSENEKVLKWAEMVRTIYDRAKQRLYEWQHGPYGLSPPSLPSSRSESHRHAFYNQLVRWTKRLGLLYAQSKEHKSHPCHALCKRLLRHIDELFQFVLVPGLASDNNLAERAVRPVVIMRKISGGSKSPTGSATRMTLASLFGTWQAKGLNPFTQCLALLSSPLHPSPPLI